MDILAKLFGSAERVKVMRLFLLNPAVALGSREAAARCKLKVPMVAGELARLRTVGLVTKRAKGSRQLWQFNPAFPYAEQLKSLMKNDLAGQKKELVRQFAACGKVTLLIMAGVFIDHSDSRADLVIVGEKLKRPAIDRIVRVLEIEVGREINYAVFGTADFTDRWHGGDRFVRDVLDYPHDVVIDKINLSTAA